jgi:hypothetical protein
MAPLQEIDRARSRVGIYPALFFSLETQGIWAAGNTENLVSDHPPGSLESGRHSALSKLQMRYMMVAVYGSMLSAGLDT